MGRRRGIGSAATVALLLTVFLPMPATAGGNSTVLRVVTLSATADDPRIALTRDAVRFWNRAFQDLDLASVLIDGGAIVGSPDTRVFENYAWGLSRSAGRLAPGARGPEPPPEILAIDAEVVVLLSAQQLMPFAWPLSAGSLSAGSLSEGDESEPGAAATARARQTFIAIRADSDYRGDTPGMTRNVIAHEIGHALGLTHQDDPVALMCFPCAHASLEAETPALSRLTARDRALLKRRFSIPASAAERR